MSKQKSYKFKFIEVDNLPLAATLVLNDYEIEDCIHSKKHNNHKYLFYEKSGMREIIKSFHDFSVSVDPVLFLRSVDSIKKDFLRGCNESK
jgi:hypothetical protein